MHVTRYGVQRADLAMRMFAMLVIAFGLAGAALFASPARGAAHAQDAENRSVSVVAGDCDDPDEIVAELKPARVAEGGALTSFTTIDQSIEDLTGDDHAVLVGEIDELIACGDIAGEGTDLYLPLAPSANSQLSGIAWLHDRDGRTQISLFLGENLGGTGAETTDEPSDDPEPPADETPEPDEQSSGNTETYIGEVFGYTITFDSDVWYIETKIADVESDEPMDYAALSAVDETASVEFIGAGGNPQATAERMRDVFSEQLRNRDGAVATQIREDADGNPIQFSDEERAFVALDVTFDDPDEGEFTITYYVAIWELGNPGELLAMIFQTDESNFERWSLELAMLEAGITLPSD